MPSKGPYIIASIPPAKPAKPLLTTSHKGSPIHEERPKRDQLQNLTKHIAPNSPKNILVKRRRPLPQDTATNLGEQTIRKTRHEARPNRLQKNTILRCAANIAEHAFSQAATHADVANRSPNLMTLTSAFCSAVVAEGLWNPTASPWTPSPLSLALPYCCKCATGPVTR